MHFYISRIQHYLRAATASLYISSHSLKCIRGHLSETKRKYRNEVFNHSLVSRVLARVRSRRGFRRGSSYASMYLKVILQTRMSRRCKDVL